MNQIFNFKRYTLLLKHQWAENAVIYKWGIILMLILTPLLFWLCSNWKASQTLNWGQQPTFVLLGVLYLYTFAGNFFESLANKSKGMFYFSMPVSSLERISVAFTFVLVLFPTLFMTVFSVFDFIFVQLFNYTHGTSKQMIITNVSLLWPFVRYYLTTASILILGSLVFGKNGIIKTVFTFSVISAAFFGLLKLFSIITQVPIKFNESKVLGFENNWLFCLIVLFCWTMLYFKMKKKEV